MTCFRSHVARVALALITVLGLAGALAAQGLTADAEGLPRTPAQIGLSPQLFEISLDEPLATHAYRLHNMGGSDTRVRIRVSHWTLDADGELVELAPDDRSLAPWLVVNPSVVDLPAGTTRAVRFSARPAHPLPPGEYRALLVFDEEPPAPADAGDPAATMRLSGRFRISSAIYASTGAVVRGGEVLGVEAGSSALVIRARGEGSGHARFQARYRIRAEGAAATVAEGDVARAPVLPGLARPVSTPFADGIRLAPGRYRVEVEGALGDSPVRVDQVVSVPAD